jgi:hypothetical protein
MKPLLQTRAALIAICVHRVGWRRAPELVQFIDDYGAFIRNKGEDLGFEDYVAWTRLYSRATAYRRLGLFRQAFPQLGPQGVPGVLFGPLLAQLASEVEAG